MTIFHAFLAATLFVSSGAWIAFTLCAGANTSERVRWAFAAVLSPAVLGLEVVVLARCGVAFESAVFWLACLNVPALALPFVKRRRGERASPAQPSIWLTLGAWLVLFAPIAIAWVQGPDYRVYGWHNAMNTAIAYQVAELPAPLEDPDLAGVRLNYGWIGHVETTAVARLLDVAPTIVFPIVNAIMLLATLVFLEAAALALRPKHAKSATLTSAFVLAGTMITGLVVHRLVPPDHPSAILHELSGDLRVAPILTKFHNFDSMVVGIAGFAALVHWIVASFAESMRRAWLLCAITALAIGLVYPLLFPFAGVVLATTFATLLVKGAGAHASSLVNDRGKLALGCAVACVVVLGYVRFLGKDAHASFLEPFHAVAILYALLTMVHAIGLWTWIAWPTVRTALRVRQGPEWPLVLALIALIAVALALQMKGDTHYKVYFAQVLVLVPLMVARIDGLLERWRAATVVLGLLVIGASATTAVWIVGEAPARERARRVVLSEERFSVEPPDGAAYDWIRALRDRTPRDAIVVAPPSDLPLAVLTGRTQYVSMAPPGDTLLGYSLEIRFLFENKGYSSEGVASRERVVQACYVAPDEDPSFAKIARDLRSLARPVVIAFPARGTGFQRWLAKQDLGAQIHRDATASLWTLAE